jgi:hypothetical protein
VVPSRCSCWDVSETKGDFSMIDQCASLAIPGP